LVRPIQGDIKGGSMDFISSIKRNCTTAAYAQFSGRASRSEYWWFYLFTVLATAAAGQLGTAASGLASIFFFLPSLALFVRRLHDVGRSGKWFLLVFTIVGILVVFYWLIKDSDAGANKYGKGPERA
jgi:uncharacterized membrane protein YhaH (DUF805 family)